MDPKSSSDNVLPIRGRGIQEAQVWEAADTLIREGLRPTIERVRQKIGSGSPNTVSPMLERWFATLGKRLGGQGDSLASNEAQQLPLAIVQAAQHFWDAARREADRAQLRASEAIRRALEMDRTALSQKEADLQQREAALEQGRVALDEALTSSRLAIAAMETQLRTQQEEAARRQANSDAEARRLQKALEQAAASLETLRESSAVERAARQRAAQDAEERHQAHERRLLAELDRERMATRDAAGALAKAQKSHELAIDAARRAQGAAQQALHDELAAHSAAAAAWSLRQQEDHVESATLRERLAGTEQRAVDLASQLERQQLLSEREIAQLRDGHIAMAAALRQIEVRPKPAKPAKAASPARSKQSSI